MAISNRDSVKLKHRLQEADRVLLGDASNPPAPLRAAEMYLAAAHDGLGAAAARAAMLAAVGVGRPQNWTEALDLLLQGAELGDRPARRQLAVIAGHVGDRLASGDVSTAALWRKLRAEIDIDSVLTPPPATHVSSSPLIGVLQGFAPPAYAAWLIRAAADRLEPSRIYDEALGELRGHETRTATVAEFTMLHRDVVLAILQERAARATGIAVYKHEPPNVIRYIPGQKFDEHFDFVDPDFPNFNAEIQVYGQRVATCLTYLNTDFMGAETRFPDLGFQFRGKLGDCLIFYNVLPDGQPDRRTRHAGLPPTQGRKWLLSQWLRDKPQVLV